jgi:hypothetical protein
MKPQFSRQDGSYGHVLLGNGKMDFTWQNYSESGFFTRGEMRHLKPFTDKQGRKYMVAAMNNSVPKIFKYTNQ